MFEFSAGGEKWFDWSMAIDAKLSTTKSISMSSSSLILVLGYIGLEFDLFAAGHEAETGAL